MPIRVVIDGQAFDVDGATTQADAERYARTFLRRQGSGDGGGQAPAASPAAAPAAGLNPGRGIVQSGIDTIKSFFTDPDFRGGFVRHMLTDEPEAMGALGVGAALTGGIPAALTAAAWAPAAADVVSRGAKAGYGEPQPPVTAGEVVGDSLGPLMEFAAPAARLARPAARLAARVGGKGLEVGGKFAADVAGSPIAEIASPGLAMRAKAAGKVSAKVGESLQALGVEPLPELPAETVADRIAHARELIDQGFSRPAASKIAGLPQSTAVSISHLPTAPIEDDVAFASRLMDSGYSPEAAAKVAGVDVAKLPGQANVLQKSVGDSMLAENPRAIQRPEGGWPAAPDPHAGTEWDNPDHWGNGFIRDRLNETMRKMSGDPSYVSPSLQSLFDEFDPLLLTGKR